MSMRRFTLIAVIAATAVTVGARDRWSSKPWQKWSVEDCKNMLQNSPWAQTWSTSTEVFPTMGQSSEGTAREQEPVVYYYVQRFGIQNAHCFASVKVWLARLVRQECTCPRHPYSWVRYSSQFF